MSTTTASFGRIRSSAKEVNDPTVSSPPIKAERRIKSRYPLDLSVRFRFLYSECLRSGVGRTVNLGAGGLLIASPDFESCDELRAGAWVEIGIEWPVLLDGRIPLQLFGVGRVVRRGNMDFAVKFFRHEFRTMKRSVLPEVLWGAKFVPSPLRRPRSSERLYPANPRRHSFR